MSFFQCHHMSCCHDVILTWILMCLHKQENNGWEQDSILGMHDLQVPEHRVSCTGHMWLMGMTSLSMAVVCTEHSWLDGTPAKTFQVNRFQCFWTIKRTSGHRICFKSDASLITENPANNEGEKDRPVSSSFHVFFSLLMEFIHWVNKSHLSTCPTPALGTQQFKLIKSHPHRASFLVRRDGQQADKQVAK